MEILAIIILAVSGGFTLGAAFNSGAYDRGYRDGFRFHERLSGKLAKAARSTRDDGTFGY